VPTMGEEGFLKFMEAFGKQKPIAAASPEDQVNWVASGQSAMSLISLDRLIDRLDQGATIEPTPLSPLHSIPIYSWAIRGGPHPNSAKLLLAWLGTPEAKQILLDEVGWSELNPCGPTRADKVLCGKGFDIFRVDTIEKAQLSDRIRPAILKALDSPNSMREF